MKSQQCLSPHFDESHGGHRHQSRFDLVAVGQTLPAIWSWLFDLFIPLLESIKFS